MFSLKYSIQTYTIAIAITTRHTENIVTVLMFTISSSFSSLVFNKLGFRSNGIITFCTYTLTFFIIRCDSSFNCLYTNPPTKKIYIPNPHSPLFLICNKNFKKMGTRNMYPPNIHNSINNSNKQSLIEQKYFSCSSLSFLPIICKNIFFLCAQKTFILLRTILLQFSSLATIHLYHMPRIINSIKYPQIIIITSFSRSYNTFNSSNV